jgi:tRNA-Thr(GGU) m(6)t(6)A37 methyltransferase TsaA
VLPTDTLVCTPIGYFHSPFSDRVEAPRQSAAARDVRATIELRPGCDFEHALEDLDEWSHLWVLFWFHLNEGWRPKVLPPRSARRRGVFSTRSPHRPNPIGLSVVKLEGIDGLWLTVSGIDVLDGTPVLDIKPYVPYADAVPDADDGWLETARDPGPRFEVAFDDRAEAALAYLLAEWQIDLRPAIVRVLELGPEPHPYRRIKQLAGVSVLAVKDWRADFACDGSRVRVQRIRSGYRTSQLAGPAEAAPAAHRAFALRFGAV